MFPVKSLKYFFILIILVLSSLFLNTDPGYAQDSNMQAVLDDSIKEIDFYSLEELLNIEVDVASMFKEDELVVGSSVSSITPNQWKQMGARRTFEALNNEMSMVSFPSILCSNAIGIRGYLNAQSNTGIATIVDGVPINDFNFGSSFYNVPNWELGTLDKIELIKGPGSSIYGSDAFHGVISMKTFESDKNFYSIEGAGAYPLYGDANFKISQGMADNLLRIDASAGLSHQGDQDLEFDYIRNDGSEGTSERKWQYYNQTGVLKLKLNPSDKLKIKIGGYVNNFSGEDFAGSGVSAIPGTLLEDNDLASNNALLLMGNGLVSYTLPGEVTVEASGYYWAVDLETKVGFDRLSYVYETYEGNRTGANITIKQPDNSLNLQWLVAYSFTSQKVVYDNLKLKDLNDNLLLDQGDQLASGENRNINSVFTQLKWSPVKDILHLLVGGRLDNYSDFGNQLTPRGGIIVQPDKNSSVKILYGRAFMAPTAVTMFGYEGILAGNKDLKPETIDIYELIYVYKGKDWKLNLSGFYSYWKNGVITKFDESGNASFTNEGKNDSYGGEVTLFYTINPFAFDLGFSYVRSKAIDAQVKDESGQLVMNSDGTIKTEDQEYDQFPEYSAFAGMHYNIKAIDTTVYLNNRLYINMKEKPREVDPSPDKISPYYRLDLNVSKNIAGSTELYLDMRNLLNRKNRVPSVIGAENGYTEPGISVLLRAGYRL